MGTTLTIGSIADFQQSLSEKGRSLNTIKAYCSDVRIFFVESGLNSLEVESLPSLVADWMNKNRDKEKDRPTPRTLRRRMASLREYGEWAGQQNLLRKYKLPSVVQATPHPLPGLDKDLQSMLDKCKTDMQRTLVALLGLEGLRLHEALDLRVEHLNLADMTMKILGKGQKERTLPITERAWDYLCPRIIAAKLAHDPKLVHYSDRGARHFVTTLAVAAGISRPVASHDLRATFATLAYQNSGHNIILVQWWLGHRDVSTTQVYLGITPEQMRQAGNF